MMTWLYEFLLKLSITAAQKICKEEVEQVDVWFKSGKQVCLMSRDSAQQLKRVAENLRDEWTPEQVDRLKTAIISIRKDELNG
ncbi:hypothetical protein LMA44_17585 [Enterobacter hormaechei]|uniref:hypothetical protein n=1 Tax=Enterobacter hormaechei TaxID=158836 RepID=UPI001E4B3A77|nr:hypothetical protein [Enterobacter hormaechei]MCC4519037.1 hypothetical protein [Enterobacter hormaechei]MCC4543803.1 hypothetical protein [Enterobacter hormaechei]MCC4550435.1 hypothetical protein [Enterobacter hormaechei]